MTLAQEKAAQSEDSYQVSGNAHWLSWQSLKTLKKRIFISSLLIKLLIVIQESILIA